MCVGIVLVFDITRRETFENLDLWIKEVKQYCAGGMDRITMILVGNKLDRKEERKVDSYISPVHDVGGF